MTAVELTYRDLRAAEFALLETVDRAEHIDGHYVVDGDTLRLVRDDFDVTGWYPTEVDDYVTRLQTLHDFGGVVLGAFDRTCLVALASLDVTPISIDPVVLKLDMLYVSAGCRHRGIGRRMIDLLVERARNFGAAALYISSTPTRNTVDAYRDVGAVVNPTPDPYLFGLEPDDIHLILTL